MLSVLYNKAVEERKKIRFRNSVSECCGSGTGLFVALEGVTFLVLKKEEIKVLIRQFCNQDKDVF